MWTKFEVNPFKGRQDIAKNVKCDGHGQTDGRTDKQTDGRQRSDP